MACRRVAPCRSRASCGFVDKIPMGAAFNKGNHFAGETHKQHAPRREGREGGDRPSLADHRLALDAPPGVQDLPRQGGQLHVKVVLKRTATAASASTATGTPTAMAGNGGKRAHAADASKPPVTTAAGAAALAAGFALAAHGAGGPASSAPPATGRPCGGSRGLGLLMARELAAERGSPSSPATRPSLDLARRSWRSAAVVCPPSPATWGTRTRRRWAIDVRALRPPRYPDQQRRHHPGRPRST